MTPKQDQHLEYLLATAKSILSTKYRAGAAEHEGDLLDMPASQLLMEAVYENIDQLVYLLTALEKLKEVKNKYEQQHLQPPTS